MNGKWKTLSVITFAVLMLAIPLVHADVPTEPQNGDAMWIEPSSVDLRGTSAGVGYKFNVTVFINLTIDSASWQFNLVYNKSHLNATGTGYTAGDKSDFFHNVTTIPLSPTYSTYNTTHDSVLDAESWMLGLTRGPGYGSLAWVEFQVMTVPPSGETYTSMIGLVDLYPSGTMDTYAQQPDGTKIALTSYDSTYTIPEFSGITIVALLMCLAAITILARKVTFSSHR